MIRSLVTTSLFMLCGGGAFAAGFAPPPDLRDYPADHQTLTIQLVTAGLTSDQVELVPSSEGGRAISADLSVADFDITGSEVVVET
jgi:hypothetical protein